MTALPREWALSIWALGESRRCAASTVLFAHARMYCRVYFISSCSCILSCHWEVQGQVLVRNQAKVGLGNGDWGDGSREMGEAAG